MSGKDRKEAKKADKIVRAAALREFLVAMPGALERIAASFGWLVVLGGVALVALILHLAFGGERHPPAPVPGGLGDNPSAAVYVRDLGRLADGRHTFDLVYELVLRNETTAPFAIDFSTDSLSIGDLVNSADVVWLDHENSMFGRPEPKPSNGIAWQVQKTNAGRFKGGLVGEYPPGRWRTHVAHYRIVARVDQFADIAIGYSLPNIERPGVTHLDDDPLAHDEHHEEVQLGAVLRAHCALGVKIQNGEMRSLCAN